MKSRHLTGTIPFETVKELTSNNEERVKIPLGFALCNYSNVTGTINSKLHSEHAQLSIQFKLPTYVCIYPITSPQLIAVIKM